MLFRIDNEIRESHNDRNTVRFETSMFRRPPSESQPTHRRVTGVGFVTLAAVGLFGGGVAVRDSDSCGLQGIFRGCHDKVQAVAANIRRLSEYQDVLTQFVTEFSTKSNEKFVVKNELAALNAFLAEMASTQTGNWTIIREVCSS